MKEQMILLLALLLAACGDLSVEPIGEFDDRPAWCDERAYQIEGPWGREFTRRGRQFRTDIQMEAVGPCTFGYTVMVLQQSDESHAEGRIHLSLGTLVITDYEQSGPVGLLTVETRRTRQENRRPDGVTEADLTAKVFDTQIAKIWDDGLAIWGNFYTRR